MGTRVNQYLMLAIELEFDEARRLIEAFHGDNAEEMEDNYSDNGYRPEITHVDGMTLIMDGMNGEYAYFGIIKEKARIDDWLDCVTIGKAKPKEIRLIEEKAKLLFGPDFEGSPAWRLVTHWH